MSVHQIVLPLAAVLVQRLGNLALFVDEDVVLPLAATGKVDLVLHRAVGIDGVAGMQEEVGRILADRGIGLHAGVVDAPALAGGIAGPSETDIALRGRRRAEATNDRLGDGVDVGEIGRDHAVEDVLVGGEVGEQPLYRVIAGRRRIERRKTDGVGEIFRRRHFEHDARRAVGASPHHAAGCVDIARLDAMGEGGPLIGARIIRKREARYADEAGGAHGRDEGAPGHRNLVHGCLLDGIERRRQGPASMFQAHLETMKVF